MPVPRAQSEEDAANLALDLLREESITSINDDNVRARTARRWFGSARDEALQRTDWNFATAWCEPAMDPTAVPGPLKKRYPLPEDCITVRFVDGLCNDDWDVQNAAIAGDPPTEVNALVTNADAPVVCYTRRVESVRLWSPEFLVAFAKILAGYMAPKFGKSSDNLEAVADVKFSRASTRDAREKAATEISYDTSWIAARDRWP